MKHSVQRRISVWNILARPKCGSVPFATLHCICVHARKWQTPKIWFQFFFPSRCVLSVIILPCVSGPVLFWMTTQQLWYCAGSGICEGSEKLEDLANKARQASRHTSFGAKQTHISHIQSEACARRLTRLFVDTHEGTLASTSWRIHHVTYVDICQLLQAFVIPFSHVETPKKHHSNPFSCLERLLGLSSCQSAMPQLKSSCSEGLTTRPA